MSLSTQAQNAATDTQNTLVVFLHLDGLPFSDTLTAGDICDAIDACSCPDECIYTPAVTLISSLIQVLYTGPNRSGRASVDRVITYLAMQGRPTPSDDDGTYTRARHRLSVDGVRDLVGTLAERCEDACPDEFLWHGRHVALLDGTTFSAPDTPANQAEFPQPKTQKRGVGCPLMRAVFVFSLVTGMARAMAVGPYKGKATGETALLRSLLDVFKPGDVLLGDRIFASYFMIAEAIERRLDVVFRHHQSRNLQRGVLSGWGRVTIWSCGRSRPSPTGWIKRRTTACRTS